jgi:hypothetical protein
VAGRGDYPTRSTEAESWASKMSSIFDPKYVERSTRGLIAKLLFIVLMVIIAYNPPPEWYGIRPALPKPPKGPEIALSCWVASPKDEVTIKFTGMIPASKISARLTDATAPFAMTCQYQFETPKLPGWQYTEEGNPGIQ